MPRLDELLLGKIRAGSHFDPDQPEGVFKLCGRREHVISWDQDRCPSCDAAPVWPSQGGAIQGTWNPPPPWPKGAGSGNDTRIDGAPNPPMPAPPKNPTTKTDRTVLAPLVTSEVTITLRLKPGYKPEDSPMVRLTVGDNLVLLVENGRVTPSANGWWDIAVDKSPTSERR